jgi:hypothetical protein
MRKLIAIAALAVFSAVTFSAYAADATTTTPPPAKTKKKKSKTPAAQSSTSGGVQAGGETVNQPGRGDPTPAKGTGAVTSPQPTGAGRSNNQ